MGILAIAFAYLVYGYLTLPDVRSPRRSTRRRLRSWNCAQKKLASKGRRHALSSDGCRTGAFHRI
jgi:hypothetical protein